MKFCFSTVLFFFFTQQILAQSGNLTIEWDGEKTMATQRGSFKIPTFKKHHVYDNGQIFYRELIDSNGFVDEESISISDLRSTTISRGELVGLDINKIPEGIQVSLENALSRKRNYQMLTVSPIYKENGSFKKLISLSYSFSPSSRVNNERDDSRLRSSLLQGGEWFRIEVTESGIQSISRSLLQRIGINVDIIDPRNIKIYGHGGRSMSLINGVDQFFGPPELAIQVIGEEDGSFDAQDAILFYGTNAFDEYVPENDSFINPYSDNSYYYITVSNSRGKRVTPYVQPAGTIADTYDYYHARGHYERDLVNIGSVGRIWYGETFDFDNEQFFELSFDQVDTSRNPLIRVLTGAISDTSTSMEMKLNGSPFGTTSFNALSPTSSILAADRRQFFNQTASASANLRFDITYNNGGNPAATGYLDYIWVDMPTMLNGAGASRVIRNLDANRRSGIGVYNFINASNIAQVWRITDRFNITSFTNIGQNANFDLRFRQGQNELFYTVDPTRFKTPVIPSNSRVVNQNLKGSIFSDSQGNFRDVDYLIITPATLLSQAQRLANYHILNSNLNTKVVTLASIYEEFSEGEQDIAAIRNFIKYVYDNASDPSRRLQYVNMFGDASYDYKDRLSVRDNIVPTYLSSDSVSLTFSFCSDDFFVLMDQGEGSLAASDLMDIAVGRMLVSDLIEAQVAVDKIIAYESEPAFDQWRNRITLIGDDIDEPFDEVLQRSTNDLANEIIANRPEYNINKILLDSYPQIRNAGGDRYPDAVADITNAIEQGSLIVNYFGHGNEDALAREFVITQASTQALRHPNRLPLLITVTCSFTRYDNPLRVSGGELALLNARGGAIASVATNRLIFIGTGTDFNRVVDEYLFSYNSVEPTSIAESLRLAKLDPGLANDPTRRVIAFLGDPALKLAFPKPRVELTTVNGSPISSTTLPLRALDRVTLGGEVQDLSGNRIPNYDGEVSLTLFDKQIDRETLGNDGVTDGSGLITLEFDQLGEVLFRGQATITNGEFEVQFVMPRDTQIPLGNGRVSMYAKRDGQLEDQNGVSLDVPVGGINENAAADNTGPLIDPYMNDTNFVSGGVTNSDPLLLVLLNDENGINTASGIGHDITAILDGDEANPFVMNDYYEADVDDFTSGRVLFPLRDIEPGLHTLKITAWDTYNNSSMAEIQFVVSNDDGLQLSRVLNYPNPFTSYTEFWFNHNKPFEPLEVQVQVMTVTGKIVWTTNQNITTSGFTAREITWDGRDDFGQRLGKGVYVYKIRVRSTLSNETASVVEKLVIL